MEFISSLSPLCLFVCFFILLLVYQNHVQSCWYLKKSDAEYQENLSIFIFHFKYDYNLQSRRECKKKNNKKNLYNSTNTYSIAIVHSYNFYIYIKKKIKNILINICTQNETKKSKKINLMKKMEMMTMIWFKRKYGT